VESRAPDREAILASLPGVLGTPLDDDQVAVVDAFLTGLRTPVVASVL